LQTVNYLAQDSLQQALTAIEHAQKLVKKESVGSCDIQLTVALCQLRFNEYSQALTTLESSLSCLESHPPVHSMKIVENAEFYNVFLFKGIKNRRSILLNFFFRFGGFDQSFSLSMGG